MQSKTKKSSRRRTSEISKNRQYQSTVFINGMNYDWHISYVSENAAHQMSREQIVVNLAKLPVAFQENWLNRLFESANHCK